MENLNAETVKKALECCTSGKPCRECEYKDKSKDTFGCRKGCLIDALALINSQEQRIKELTEEKTHLEYTLDGVMLSVDKWLDGAELEQDEVNRAITMREKTLQIVEKLTEENERLRERNITLEQKLMLLGIDEVYVFKAQVKGE